MTKNIPKFKIGNSKIGQGYPVFIVAEISGNHNQSFAQAKKLVKIACECGVDAVKLQTATPEGLTIDCDKKWFQINANPAWRGQTLYQLYQKTYTPWEWQPKLKKIADSYGIPLFSTPFEKKAVDFLEKMQVPAYKIASFEIGDLELLKKMASTKKPMIISRGMASISELKLALKILRENGAPKIAVLHCISSYPAKPEEMNLATIPDIKKKFKLVSGLSDHTLGTYVAIAATALGASIIEKHFTLDRSDGGPDSAFSIEPKELKELVQAVRLVEKAVGKVQYKSSKKELENIVFKRSLFVVNNIKKGEEFSKKNVRSIRPGHGLAPKYINQALGKKAGRDIERGTPLQLDLIQK